MDVTYRLVRKERHRLKPPALCQRIFHRIRARIHAAQTPNDFGGFAIALELSNPGVRLRFGRNCRGQPAGRERRRSVTWEFVTILMLVTFILGLFMGASLVRPKG